MTPFLVYVFYKDGNNQKPDFSIHIKEGDKMDRIAVISPSPSKSIRLCRQMARCLAEMGYFPLLEIPEDLEAFYYAMRASPPDGILLVMDGIAGLNTAEHLRHLGPDCTMIWCCDLDFSLQAYRLRVDYFIQGNPTEESLRQGILCWQDRQKL